MSQNLLAAVNLSVSPSAVSNTYNGDITLQITGLTPGETVVVQKFLDANTNGLIDGADLLWQQFRLTDGQASVIGGVTNINVPGDTDSASGTITASWDFQQVAISDVVQTFIGRYIYRLSSPAGLFPPTTKSLLITNTAYAQGLTGHITNHGTNVPNALVLLFVPDPGDDGPGTLVAGIVADNFGDYTLKASAGMYGIGAVRADYLGNLAALPVNVSGGVMVAKDFALTNTSQTISGRLVEAGNNAVGLPGLLIHVIADDGLTAIANSDTNGNFSLPVAPAIWSMGFDGETALGYLGLDTDVSVDTTTGSVSGLIITMPKATALFYGSVSNDLHQPVAGVRLYSEDDNGPYEQDVATDRNGRYVVGALGGGGWSVEIDNEQPFATNYLFTEGFYTNINSGQAVRHDFLAFRAMNHISGYLRDNIGNPIPNVTIYAYANIGGVSFETDMETDASGFYSLNVVNGVWQVNVIPGGYSSSLSGDYLRPAGQTVGITNNNATVNFIASLAPYHITGTVKDNNGNAIPNVSVYASATVSGMYYSQWNQTDAGGNYSLGVTNGTWNVGVCFDCDDVTGYCQPNAQLVPVSNGNAIANFMSPGEISITTSSSLPDAYLNESYSTSFAAMTCGSGGSWSAYGLPSGLELSPGGTLSGFPDTLGSNYFTVRVDVNSGGYAVKSFSLVVRATDLDVYGYYVNKVKGHRQTNAANAVVDNIQGPYKAYLGIAQAPITGLVTSATCTLPTTAVKTFPSGDTAFELQVSETFASQPAIDAAYPAGSYAFSIHGIDDGDQSAVLDLDASPYPNAPHIANYAAAQAINPLSDFTLQWDPFSGGTNNDYIRLTIVEGSGVPAFALWWYPVPIYEHWFDSAAAADSIPAGTLQPGHDYLGVLMFVRVADANDTDYPGAYGEACVTAQTVFNLSTVAPAPALLLPSRPSASQFSFMLNGVAGQNYTIQKNTNLGSTNWSVLYVTNAPANLFPLVDPSATNGRAYYRALFGP